MLDLRYVNVNGAIVLQMRTCGLTIDASGAFCGTSPWSEWKPVPLAGDQPKQDWRVGIAVKPKMAKHLLRGRIGVVRKIVGTQLIVEVDGREYNEPSDDWMTA